MAEPIPASNLGDANWVDLVNNWRDADATWLQERSIVRVAGTPVVGSSDGQVANTSAGRVFYDSTNNKLILSLGSSTYKNVLASTNLNPAIDSSTDVVLKVNGASYGITLKSGSGSIVLDKINTLTVDTTGSNSATVTTTTNVDSASTVEISAPIKVASGTTILRGSSVASTAVTATGAVTGGTLVSTVATGTAPLTVTSNTVVPNLNASLLEGANKATLLDLGNATNTLNLTSKASGLLAIGYGGTGTATTPAVGGVVYGASTSAYGITSAGVTGQVITSTGAAAPTWQYPDLFTCTLATRPSSPAIGQAIYETDTGNFLIYYGSPTGWKPPWNQPWGVVGTGTITSDITIGTSVTTVLSTSSSVNLREDRLYSVSAQGSLYSLGAASSMTLTPVFTQASTVVVNLPLQTQNVTYINAWNANFYYTPATSNTTTHRIRFTASAAGTSMLGASYNASLTITDIGPAGTAPSA